MKVLCLGVVLLLTACTAAGVAGDPPSGSASAGGATPMVPLADPTPSGEGLARPEVAPAPCPDAVTEEGATCGFVVVPETREDPASPVVEVAWLRLPAVDRAVDPPLVVLPDGPGQSTTAEAGEWATSPLRRTRDVVLVDPRGTGRSFPSLDCGEPPRPGALPPDLVEDCRRQLVAEGVALTAYDTAAMAADVVDLVDALELDRVALLGIGHGARTALGVVDARPEVVAALVLDSPVPPQADVYAERPVNAQAALHRLFDECAQAPACADRYGDLLPAVEATVADLDEAAAGTEGADAISGEDLVLAAVAAMRGVDGPRAVPAALATAVEGDPAAALARLQEVAVAGAAVPTSAFAEGVRLSADCRDEVPFTDGGRGASRPGLDVLGQAVAADVDRLLAACATWRAGRATATATLPVGADVPGLVLTGEFDPLSPPAWGAAAAGGLDAVVVQVGAAGHRVHDVDDCTTGIVDAFLARPSAAPDSACAAEAVIDFARG